MSRARSSRATPPPSRRRRFALATALAATLALGADESAARSPGGAALTLRPGLPQVSLTLPEPLPAPSEAEQQYFPFLDGEPIDHTISVGDTSNGFLVNGRAVEESAALGILPIQRERDLRYGSEELVALLEQSAASYYAATKSRMWIGNVGKRRGGDIPWSVSHNSGRDADIAFAYLDLSGKPVDPPDLVPLNQDGLNATYRLRFDAARTWQIVRGLLAGDAEVQYLFIASGLRDQLLVHAQKAGEPAALIQKAAIVMRQPVGAAPHSDHLHLRIYCSRRDVLGGCVNTGAVHDFAELHEDAKEAAVARIAKVMGAGDTEQQKRAIERLVLLGAREQADAIAAHL
ncbi:MAG: penicillin-insensitive murein endopeptidase, partial [Polyangiaceae bacterium]